MDDLTVKIMEIIDVGFENPRNRYESRLSWATRFRLAYEIRRAVRAHYAKRRVGKPCPAESHTENGPHGTSPSKPVGSTRKLSVSDAGVPARRAADV